jgi:hypothetical protein
MGITIFIWPAVMSNQQSLVDWSVPTKIFEIEFESEAIYEPSVLADSTGRVHILWRVVGLESKFLYYSSGSDGQFSEPVDVMVNVSNNFTAAIDDYDDIHLVWDDGNALYYTWVPAAQAGSARAWAKPQVISAAFMRSHIVTGSAGRLHIAMAGPDGTAVLYLVSEDNGNTWSAPVHVATPMNHDGAMSDTRLAIGTDGVIHFVWTEYKLPQGWPPLGVYYTRSDDDGLSWSTPFEIAGEGYDQLTVALVGDETVHVAWNGMAGVLGRYHRGSLDGGLTWSDINVISEEGGTQGFPHLVIDSSNTLHLLTTYSACAWYTTWLDGRWVDPVCLSHAETYYVEEAAMALSEGNRLHVVYWVDRQNLWYTSRQVNAPWIEPASSSSVTILPPSTISTPTVSTDTLASVPERELLPVPTEIETLSNIPPLLSLMISLLPVAIFVLGVVLLAIRRRR